MYSVCHNGLVVLKTTAVFVILTLFCRTVHGFDPNPSNPPPAPLNPTQLLFFDGILLDTVGNPISGAAVQFWQADTNGFYNHPLTNRGPINPDFQYYGTASTDDNGLFSLTTFKPGLYPGRPAHIHFRVWMDGRLLLTSQLYFEGENWGNPDLLTMPLETVDLGNGQGSVYMCNKTIVLNRGNGGDLPVTPSQPAGPYYPRVDFFDLDADFTNMGVQPPSGTVELENNDGMVSSNSEMMVNKNVSLSANNSIGLNVSELMAQNIPVVVVTSRKYDEDVKNGYLVAVPGNNEQEETATTTTTTATTQSVTVTDILERIPSTASSIGMLRTVFVTCLGVWMTWIV